MLHFFKKLFARTSKPSPQVRQAKLGLEGLEARDVPSAGPLLMQAGHAFAFGHAAGAVFGANSNGGGFLGDSVTKLFATLSGSSGATGHAEFRSSSSDASTNSLTVRASGLAASSTFDVQVDGTTVGQLSTDANGKGSLTL